MVLGELGNRVTAALQKVVRARTVDQELLDEMLTDLTRALIEADVDISLTKKFRDSVKTKTNLADLAAGLNKRRVIEKVVFEELLVLVNPGKKPFVPKKGKQNVIMFVGLQGAGKTTTITKFGYYYRRKGWKVGVVCADTFRAGAYAQLKQNCIKAKIAYYGSPSETDPVKAASEGVESFRAEKYDMILVDTSGRHKQEDNLFEEMRQIATLVKPNDVVFVLDASIGQAAKGQADAFKTAVEVGSVIITKLDGHAKGGGALSAVAATGSPIVFLGTGEHFDALEPFNPASFVNRLLGRGDASVLVDKIKDTTFEKNATDLMNKLEGGGEFELCDYRTQLESIMSLGSLSAVMDMIPAGRQLLGGQEIDEAAKKKQLKVFMKVMDSMTEAELNNSNLMCDSESRILRVARGSGVHPMQVRAMLEQFLQFRVVCGGVGGMSKQMEAMSRQHGSNTPKNMANQNAQIASMLPPGMLQQIGGMGNFMDMMKQFSGGAGGGGMADMMQSMMGGMGGAAGAAGAGRGRGRGRRRR